MQSEINLLKPIYSQAETINPIQSEIKRFSFWGFMITVCLAVIILIVNLVISGTLSVLESSKTSLTNDLNRQKNKESMFLVMKSRIGIVDKALESGKPMAKMLVKALEIGQPPKLGSVNQDDQDRINLILNIGSVEEAVSMVATLVNQYNQKLNKNPQIDSFSISKTGINLILSFMPIWKNYE
jgi:hypothetical protein